MPKRRSAHPCPFVREHICTVARKTLHENLPHDLARRYESDAVRKVQRDPISDSAIVSCLTLPTDGDNSQGNRGIWIVRQSESGPSRTCKPPRITGDDDVGCVFPSVCEGTAVPAHLSCRRVLVQMCRRWRDANDHLMYKIEIFMLLIVKRLVRNCFTYSEKLCVYPLFACRDLGAVLTGNSLVSIVFIQSASCTNPSARPFRSVFPPAMARGGHG